MNNVTWEDIEKNEGSQVQSISGAEIDEVNGGWFWFVAIGAAALLWPSEAH